MSADELIEDAMPDLEDHVPFGRAVEVERDLGGYGVPHDVIGRLRPGRIRHHEDERR